MAICASVGFFLKIISAELYMGLVMMAFVHYFKKDSTNENTEV